MANERGRQGYPQQQHTQADDLLGPDPAAQMQPNLMTAQSLRASQMQYKGNQHSDLVKVKVIKDGKYLKAGQELLIHPTSACILKEMGLIADLGIPYVRPPYENKDVTVDV